jgi:hypothetical protein
MCACLPALTSTLNNFCLPAYLPHLQHHTGAAATRQGVLSANSGGYADLGAQLDNSKEQYLQQAREAATPRRSPRNMHRAQQQAEQPQQQHMMR